MEVEIVSVVMIIPFLVLSLISSSSDIQENEVQSFSFSDVLGNITRQCTVLCAG